MLVGVCKGDDPSACGHDKPHAQNDERNLGRDRQTQNQVRPARPGEEVFDLHTIGIITAPIRFGKKNAGTKLVREIAPVAYHRLRAAATEGDGEETKHRQGNGLGDEREIQCVEHKRRVAARAA